MPVTEESPLAIRDLMLATFIAAAAFGLARLSPASQQDKKVWIAWFLAFGIASCISTIAMLPACALLMRARPLKQSLIYSGLYASMFIAVEWMNVGILIWRAPQFVGPYPIYVALSCLMMSFAGTLVLAALAARAEGYQLTWGRREPTT